MIKPCTLRDLSTLQEIFQRYYNSNQILWVRERIYSEVHKLFLFKEELVVSYEMIGEYKYCVHLVGHTKDIKGLRDFIIQTGSWMMDNTRCRCILAFASEENKRLQMFIGLTGGKRLCTIPNAGGDTSEVLYIYPFESKKELEGRVKWATQYQQ